MIGPYRSAQALGEDLIGCYGSAQALGEDLGRARTEGGKADRAGWGWNAEKESERIPERRSDEKSLRRARREDVVMKSYKKDLGRCEVFRLRWHSALQVRLVSLERKCLARDDGRTVGKGNVP